MNKQYVVSTMLTISCFGAVGALIPSVISMPVEAVDCDIFPYAPTCIDFTSFCVKHPEACVREIPPRIFKCDWCPPLIFDPKLILEHPNWNITISSHQGADSTTISVTIPNEIIDALKTKMETASLQQQNSSMVK
jgi:hypothetical protein